jgi:hypothetical protein
MSVQPGPRYARPWGGVGLGWVFAIGAAGIAALGLLHAINIDATLVQVEILLVALALLI